MTADERPPLAAPIAALVAGAALAGAIVPSARAVGVPAGVVLLVPIMGGALTVFRRAAVRAGDQWAVRLVAWAVALKLVGGFVRYGVQFNVYGTGDSFEYHRAGVELMRSFRDGFLHYDGKIIGTGFLEIVTGAVYTVIGPNKAGGYLVFALLGFCGLWAFWRALAVATPDADRRLYALAVFFMPSLLFWSSSIGKEAWMTLTLGATAYGAARILAGRPGGFAVVALGSAGSCMVRPHVALIVLMALAVAYAVPRRSARGAAPRSLSRRVVGVAILASGALVVVGQTERFFGVDDFSSSSREKVFAETERRTGQGGSAYDTSDRSAADIPEATVSVLFRPFPWEAHNWQAMLASAEGVVLAVLGVRRRRQLVAAIRQASSTAYVALCVSYAALFVYAFSSIGNFGIVARERVQVYPLLLVLLVATPVTAAATRPAPAAAVPNRRGPRVAVQMLPYSSSTMKT